MVSGWSVVDGSQNESRSQGQVQKEVKIDVMFKAGHLNVKRQNITNVNVKLLDAPHSNNEN